MTDKFTHIPAAYEIVSLEYIDEIKPVQESLFWLMMMKIKPSISVSELLQRTVPALPILWNTRFCAVQRSFLPRILL